MTYLVPFDGSALAEAALERATEFADLTDADVVALAVVPLDERDFAVERGWIEEGERYDPDEVASALEAQVKKNLPRRDVPL